MGYDLSSHRDFFPDATETALNRIALEMDLELALKLCREGQQRYVTRALDGFA